MRLVVPVFPNLPGLTTKYLPVPSYVSPGGTSITTRQQFSLRERLKILFAGNLWLTVLVYGKALQPFRFTVDNPAKEDKDGNVVLSKYCADPRPRYSCGLSKPMNPLTKLPIDFGKLFQENGLPAPTVQEAVEGVLSKMKKPEYDPAKTDLSKEEWEASWVAATRKS